MVSSAEALFETDCRARQEAAVDETKVEVGGEEHYVWAAVDCEGLEVLTVQVSLGRSSLDPLLFPRMCSHGAAIVHPSGPTAARGTAGRLNC